MVDLCLRNLSSDVPKVSHKKHGAAQMGIRAWNLRQARLSIREVSQCLPRVLGHKQCNLFTWVLHDPASHRQGLMEQNHSRSCISSMPDFRKIGLKPESVSWKGRIPFTGYLSESWIICFLLAVWAYRGLLASNTDSRYIAANAGLYVLVLFLAGLHLHANYLGKDEFMEFDTQ